MNKTAILLFLLFTVSVVSMGFAQKKVTISGYLKDKSNGEAIIGGTVYIPEIESGASSNIYGFYSISLPPGDYTLVFSYIGFGTFEKKVSLTEDLTFNYEMEASDVALDAVVVEGEKKDQNVTSIEMSVQKMDVKTIESMPAFFGEPDVIKSALLLPGVTSVGEGASGFNVRGGNIDQNLILLDGAPVYNSSHLFGFFSIFNTDAIKDYKLYKGGFPAQYGGRLSSVMDIHQKEGNMKQFTGRASISSIATKLTVEGPIVKDKVSFVGSGRISYPGFMLKLSPETSDNNVYFYDLNGKVNWVISEKDRIFLSGYYGSDVLIFGDDFRWSWGNGTATLRWNHLFNNKIFSNLSVIYSDYVYNLGSDNENFAFNWRANIVNYNLKYDFTYYANSKNTVKYGVDAISYRFRPGELTSGGSNSAINDLKVPEENALELGIYLSNEQKVGTRLTLQYGLRYSHFLNLGDATVNEYENGTPRDPDDPNSFDGANNIIGTSSYDSWEVIKDFGGFEPRFSANFMLNEVSSLKGSYTRSRQYIHLVSNTTASIPIDVWKPSGRYVNPAISDQVALGYFRNFKNNAYEFSAEIYYKTFEDLLDYVDGAELILNPDVEQEFIQGNGQAYGLELQIKKNNGKLTGWISYTLARTERKITGINNNEVFPSNYDKPHDLSIVAFYQLHKKWQVSGTFTYMTGRPITYPDGRYEIEGYVLPNYSNRNGARMPDFHRLDLAVNWTPMFKPDSRVKGKWNLSIYNVYARRNAFSISFRQNEDNPYVTEAYQISIIGTIIPAIGYSLTF